MAKMTRKTGTHCWKIVEFLLITVTLTQAGFPWLVSEDEKNSWFSGPTTKCYFASKWHAIGQSFCPVLHPFGLMPCMNCTCLKNPQFAFLRPRVTCRNVRNECPFVPCADPVTKDGECCPTCHNEFIAIILPSPSFKKQRVEAGRLHLTIARKSMFFCIKLESLEKKKIKLLRLKNKSNGKIYHVIEDEEFTTSSYSGKFCHESKLPDMHPAELTKNGNMMVELHLNDSTKYDGLITSYNKFSEVPFLALLNPYRLFLKTPHIAAGIASMTTDTYNSNNKIKLRISLLFKPGDLKLDDHERRGTVYIRVIKRPWKADKLSPILKTYSFTVSQQELTIDDLLMKEFEWVNPRSAHLRWMVRGIIFVTVDFQWKDAKSHLFGRIQIHDSCRKFYSVLSGGGLTSPAATATSGFASLSLGAKTKLRFQVSGRGIPKAHKMDISIVDVNDVVFKKLGTIRRNPEEDTFQISGIWEKPSATAIVLLFKGGIFIKVATHIKINDDMRGRIKQSFYLNDANYGKASILSIHDVDSQANAKTAAAAILTADSQCNIHYVIYIGGYGDSSTAYKMIQSTLKLDGIFSRGKRESNELHLADFNQNFIARGSFRKPSEDFLIGIVSGMANIKIHTHRFITQELRGQVYFASNDCAKIRNERASTYLQRSLAGSDLNVGVCLHQGRFYDHGAEWHPLEKNGISKIYCRRCNCNKRLVTCKQISCEKPRCQNPVKAREHCCPVCTSPPNGRAVNPRKACVVGMASRNEIRAIGEAWHPVIKPFGMIKCIVCICKGAPGNSKCTTVVCPKLNCKSPERPPRSCCSVCPTKRNQNSKGTSPFVHNIEGAVTKKKAGCKYGGRFYSHGASWKPILPQFGILRCVICRCKNGRVKCRRLRCLKSARCRIRNGKIPSDPCCRHCSLKGKT